MESSDDKNWAQGYILDPLNGPDPSQETGPGSSFRPGSATNPSPTPKTSSLPSPPASPTNSRLSKNPFHKPSASRGEPGMISSLTTQPSRSASLSSKKPTTRSDELPYRSNTLSHSRNTSGNQPSPNSPTAAFPSYRQEALSNLNDSSPTSGSGIPGRRRRGSSLTSRFPGDTSHQPLAILAKEKQKADRSAHLIKKHHIQPDTIDALDDVGGASYHHSGPYDATLYARNNSVLSSPVQAVAGTNAEALKATPREKIIDAVQGHRPLDGVAAFPPGTVDRNGHLYQYEEGDNMMIGGGHEPEGGAYKRWPGVQYSKDDIKGKGEPSYTIEKQLKEKEDKGAVESQSGFEMTSRPTSKSGKRGNVGGHGGSPGMKNETWADGEGEASATAVGRSGSFSKRLSGGVLKKRIGSLKKKLQGDS